MTNDQLSQTDLRAVMYYNPDTGRFYRIRKNGKPVEPKEVGWVETGRNGRTYTRITVFDRNYNRSNLAYLYMTGEAVGDGHVIDHINRNSLDDRWLNLRMADKCQNAWNHSPRKTKHGLPRGVKANGNIYIARIEYRGVRKYIGSFSTKEEASQAYELHRKTLFGQFA